MNKMITMDKLGEAARGPFIYTLLSGKALEAVEHVKPEEYQTKGGDQVLWKLLDARFPQQEASDELSEIMGEVFGLRAKDGESMKQWTARATELFDRCYRKTGVQFPEESRGWIMLNRAGLSDEQRAVVISRARGDLKRESVAIALRSCYPDLTVSRKKAIAMVEDEALAVEDPELDEVEDFKDVDLLLEDHHLMTEGDGLEVFQESDVAEVLATSWRDKRRELNQLQKSRQFGKAREVKRAYRIEVEELKRQTACHKCGKKGHWARECRSTSTKGSSKGSKSGSAAGDAASSGAALVETQPDFVASVQPTLKLIDLMRQHNQKSDSGEVTPVEVNLVSSPGFGVLDSGCGRTIIGSATLAEFEKLWMQRGVSSPERFAETHQFRFGNGEVETSHTGVAMPVTLASHRGIIRASIVQGSAPLLISRSALKKLGAQLDFKKDTLSILGGAPINLRTNSAGQYIVDVMGSQGSAVASLVQKEVMFASTEQGPATVLDCVDSQTVPVDPQPEHPCEQQLDPVGSECPAESTSHDASPTPASLSLWTQEDCHVSQTPWLSRYGPKWSQVRERIVRDSSSKKILSSRRIIPGTPQHKTMEKISEHSGHVISEFRFVPADASEPRNPCPRIHGL